jgi:hypothetical protein
MRHSDRRQIENRPELQRQACAPRMIPSRRVDEEHIGSVRECVDCGLEDWAFA